MLFWLSLPMIKQLARLLYMLMKTSRKAIWGRKGGFDIAADYPMSLTQAMYELSNNKTCKQ